MASKLPQYGFRTKPEIMDKIRFIAKGNSRSANGEIEQAVLKHIKQWEAENFEISEDDLNGLDD